MGSYLWEEQENSMMSAGPSAVTPWFCWRRSADSPGSSCCVGQKQGPIPRQYFCLLPSYLQHRQQAWFSTSLLPFLPLSCGRSCLSWLLVLQLATFSAAGAPESLEVALPQFPMAEGGWLLMLGIHSHTLSSGSAQQRYGPVYLLSSQGKVRCFC